MLGSLRSIGLPAKMLAVAALVGLGGTNVYAQDATAPAPKRIGFSGGVDFASHFISFGADVWGGAGNASPFSAHSTMFARGTVTANLTDNAAIFVNLWSDLNDNVNSEIGGPIQEIDANFGATYTMNGFTFGATYAYWQFAGGAEKAIEGSISYADKDWFGSSGISLNPSFLVHYRFDDENLDVAQAAVLQFSINPTYTFASDNDYPITISVPAAVGYFTDPYQGGEGAGVGYVNVGIAASVPLAFIPKEYGNWSASASEVFFHTDDENIPGNDRENFFVTTLSVNVSF